MECGTKNPGYLNPYDVEIGDEIPAGFSTPIHPQETITCCIVYCIS